MKILHLAIALIAFGALRSAIASDWSVTAELKEPARVAVGFGESTAISRDGKTALVTAMLEDCPANPDCGAVYVYVQEAGSWRRQAKLFATDAVANLKFGGFGYDDNTVALSGDGNIALIGTDPDGLGTGAVYVFVRKGEIWHQQQKLTATGSIGFGRSVAISDDGKIVVVGDTFSFSYQAQARIAHVFERAGDSWEEKTQLTGSRVGMTDYRVSSFGRAVAISGDGGTILVGSPGYPSDLEEAYIFKKTKVGWLEQAILSPADKFTFAAAGIGLFGNATALSYFGDTAVIGSYSGPVYVYRPYNKFGDWRQEAKLGANIANRGGFGFSLDINDRGDRIVVGAWVNPGSIFLFQRHPDTDSSKNMPKWVPELVASKNIYSYGSSVAMSGNGKTILASYEPGVACTLAGGESGICRSVNVLNQGQ